jgi:hypothetical protein
MPTFRAVIIARIAIDTRLLSDILSTVFTPLFLNEHCAYH